MTTDVLYPSHVVLITFFGLVSSYVDYTKVNTLNLLRTHTEDLTTII